VASSADWPGNGAVAGVDFWIFGTPAPNAIPRSKNHFVCHLSFLGRPENPGGIVNELFQKYSNSRLIGKVPKLAAAAAPGK